MTCSKSRFKMGQNFIIFDSEYASWDGFLSAPAEEKKKAEIVQIAALKIDARNLNVIDELNLYVKPRFTPRLTDYFIKLTGITDELLAEKGTDFLTAYRKFLDFCGRAPCYSHVWDTTVSLGDGLIFNNNLELWQAKNYPCPQYRNIASWFQEQYQKRRLQIARQSSGQIAALLGCQDKLPAGLQPHNALYDVYSLLAGLRFLGFKLSSADA